MKVAGARRSLHEGEPCGDAYAWWREGALWTLCLADGLGHGPRAAAAAEAALAQARSHAGLSPSRLIDAIGPAIRNSRGVAIAVVRIDAAAGVLDYAGIGNVRAALFAQSVARFEGTPGIVGTAHKTPTTQSAAWRQGDLLLLWTDGFDARLKLDAACMQIADEPESIALRLLETQASGRDDAGLVCCLLWSAA